MGSREQHWGSREGEGGGGSLSVSPGTKGSLRPSARCGCREVSFGLFQLPGYEADHPQRSRYFRLKFTVFFGDAVDVVEEHLRPACGPGWM